MANARERDDVTGTAASADAGSYIRRRQGNLTRASDGFRSPTLPKEPRRPPEGGHQVDPPLRPYAYNPRPPETNLPRSTPHTWAFFRAPSPGAPKVPFPDRERTAGKLQRSGEAWGAFGTPQRPQLTPATDGRNTPPSHAMGHNKVGSAYQTGPRWKRPATPTLYDHLPH